MFLTGVGIYIQGDFQSRYVCEARTYKMLSMIAGLEGLFLQVEASPKKLQ